MHENGSVVVSLVKFDNEATRARCANQSDKARTLTLLLPESFSVVL